MKAPLWLRILAGIGVLALLAAVGGAALTLSMVRRGFSARDKPSAVEAFLAGRMRSWATGAQTRALQNPFPADATTLASARAHWADHCAGCHGNDGRGATDLGQALFPPSPDLRGPGTQKLSDGELYSIIENGIRLTGMPAWGDGAPDNRDSWSLVAFIRHLPHQTAAELAEMKALNPKSVHQQLEEEAEDAFLNAPPAPVPTPHGEKR